MIRLLRHLICLYAGISFIIGTQAQVPDSLLQQFNYRKDLPFNMQTKTSFVFTNPNVSLYHLRDSTARDTSYHVRVLQVRFAVTDSTDAEAWITAPHSFDTVTRRPLLLFQHWGEGDKDAFLSEAVSYSQRGFVCLLPDGIFITHRAKFSPLTQFSYQLYQLGVINIRRGLDLLQAQYKTDSSQVHFIGHSYGAGIGGILTGIEPRFKSFVLMTGIYDATRIVSESDKPEITEWKKKNSEEFYTWLRLMRSLDVDLYITHKKAPVFHQFATHDEFVALSDFKRYETQTPSPKKVKYYNTKHAMNAEARMDRFAYIVQQLRN